MYKQSPGDYDTIFEAGSDILGFDIKKAMFEGTKEELTRTEVSQPAIYTMSLMCLKRYTLDGGEYSAVAGHSLGEYAAMTAAGMTDTETGFTLIKHRAACMERAARKNGGVMSAIMGADRELIEKICLAVTSEGSYVAAANYNSPQQTVISGSPEGVEKASERLKEAGAKRTVPLAVAAAFHSEYMKEAALEFEELISGIVFKKPEKAFYSNVLGARLDDISDIRSLLSRHICSPVRFTDELFAMSADGADSFVECGPGKALTGMVKKTLENVSARATDNG